VPEATLACAGRTTPASRPISNIPLRRKIRMKKKSDRPGESYRSASLHRPRVASNEYCRIGIAASRRRARRPHCVRDALRPVIPQRFTLCCCASSSTPRTPRKCCRKRFVKVWTSARMFRSVRGSEVAWLISIARSRGIDKLRARKIRGDRETMPGGKSRSIRAS